MNSIECPQSLGRIGVHLIWICLDLVAGGLLSGCQRPLDRTVRPQGSDSPAWRRSATRSCPSWCLWTFVRPVESDSPTHLASTSVVGEIRSDLLSDPLDRTVRSIVVSRECALCSANCPVRSFLNRSDCPVRCAPAHFTVRPC